MKLKFISESGNKKSHIYEGNPSLVIEIPSFKFDVWSSK